MVMTEPASPKPKASHPREEPAESSPPAPVPVEEMALVKRAQKGDMAGLR